MKWRIGSQRDMIAFSGRRRVSDASNAVGGLLVSIGVSGSKEAGT